MNEARTQPAASTLAPLGADKEILQYRRVGE